jgi:tetratricopeptide (TPR) repeat protein
LPVRAQDSTGVFDTRDSVEERIYELEDRVHRVGPEEQVVMYRWLADLYVSAGRLDDAQRAYEAILVLYPFDVGTTNVFAVFLLDHRRDPVAAEKILNDAITWVRSSESPPLHLGQTHALRARALHEMGRDEDALEAVERALQLLDADAAEEALRVRARCFESMQRRDDAEAAWLFLIGLNGGSNADDISALIALWTAENKSVDASRADAKIARAIEEARRERREVLAREGAEVVVLTGEDRVRLEGTLRRGKEEGAVLFVPEPGGRRTAFTPYAQLFSLDGVTAFTIDPRGHGDSRCDSLPSFSRMPPHHRGRLPSDVATAYRYLRDTLDVPGERIVVVSEGAACAFVERAAHEEEIAPLVVHLSPVFDLQDRDIISAFEFRPPRPTLVMASHEDGFAIRSMALMTDTYPSPATETRTVHGSGHGASMLRDPANFATVSSWARRALGLSP